MDIDARYEFLDKVGTGSYATVYRARDLELGREVAIKQIHQQYLEDPEQLERYWQEAQLLASLHHPNIVTIFDIYRERGWLILELMQASLAERMAGRQMDLRALRTTIAHCLRALKYLHAQGIIHGDIKPGNMMIDARRRVKLGDFGLARRVSDEEGSLLKGTTKYMAPETVSDEFGEIGPASDLYSLGFSAYELMCGPNFESLFPGLSAFGRNKQVAWMMWHAAADRRLPPIERVLEGVPDDLRHVIQKLCEKDQSQRYQSAEEALSDLKIDVKIVNKGEAAPQAEAQPPATDPERKKRLLFAASALLASLIVCVVILFLPSGNPPAPKTRYWTVLSVDPAQREIKLVEFDGEVAKRKKVHPEAVLNLIRFDRPEPITLDELRPGDRVELEQLTDDGETILRLKAARPVISRGKQPKIDLQEGVMTVVLEGDRAGETLSLRIPKFGIDVIRNFSRKEWETATEKQRAALKNQYGARLSTIGPEDRVEFAHLPDVGGRRGRVLTGTVFVFSTQSAGGTVESVDAAHRRLIVQTQDRRLNLPVHEEAKLTLRDASGKTVPLKSLADIRSGDSVTVEFDNEFRAVQVVRAQTRLSGFIERILPGNNEILVRVPVEKRSITFRIGPQTEIRLFDEVALPTELRPGDQVAVLFNKAGGTPQAVSLRATRPPQYDRRAVLIGVQTFSDKSLPGIRYAQPNCELLENVLVQRYGLDKNRRWLVRLDNNPTRQTIREQLSDTLRRARDGTQVIVYIVTHGFVVDGRVYLSGKNIRSDNIAETGLLLDEVLKLIDETGGSKQKLVLLDLSHPWDSKPPAAQPSTAEMMKLVKTPLKHTTVITSCSGNEHGDFHRDGKHSVFARTLAAGFQGAADADRNLKITPAELFDYLKKALQQADVPSGTTQTPARFPER